MALLWALPFILLWAAGDACTLIAAGKKTTLDGSVMIAHTDDSGSQTGDLRLVRVPAMDHKKGSMRPVYGLRGGYPRIVTDDRGPDYEPKHDQKVMKPLGHIPQVEHTHGYWDQDYGMMNEKGLSIGETTCGSRTAGWPLSIKGGHNMFSIRELSKVALERCETARCAVKLMGDLAEKHGFYGDDSGPPEKPEWGGTAEALAIGDSEGEAWMFHIMTGEGNKSAIWAAQRVADDEVTTAPNGFVIRKMNLKDHDNFLASSNVQSVAHKNGWWDGKEPFDFTKAYAPTPESALVPLYVGRRIWRIFDLLAPSKKLDSRLGYVPAIPTYPFGITPDKRFDVHMIQQILRDYYEGTPYDMTKGIAAGPFADPVRYGGNKEYTERYGGAWERTISIFRCLYSFVAHVRPRGDPLVGELWYGHDAPHGTVYVPFFPNQDRTPPSYLEGVQSEFSQKSAWWAFNFVNNWAHLKFSFMQKELVDWRAPLEKEADKLVKEAEEKAHHLNHKPKELKEELGDLQVKFAEHVVASRWKFAWYLVGKFSNGVIVVGEEEHDEKVPGYPDWWLNLTGFSQWPGDTFKYLKEVNKMAARLHAAPSAPFFGMDSVLVVALGLVIAAVVFVFRPGRSQPQAGYEPL